MFIHLLLTLAIISFAQTNDRCAAALAGLPTDLTVEQFRNHVRTTLAELPEIARQVLESKSKTVKLQTEPEAWARFAGFIDDSKGAFIERDQLMDTLALTFAIDGSLLVISSKGTGKTRIGRLLYSIKDRLTDLAPVFALKLTPETTVSETSGGMIVDGALEGETERNWAFGVLGFDFVFLDDFFDARFRFLRSFLKQFNERQYVQGGKTVDGKTRVFIATTSRFLDEIYDSARRLMSRAGFDPRANIDRFNSIIYVPKEFRFTRSLVALARFKEKLPRGMFAQDLDQIRDDVARIEITRAQNLRAYLIFELMHRRMRILENKSTQEIARMDPRKRASAPPPFRATRVYSTRTMKLAYKRIAATAMLRARREGLDEVEVTDDDVDEAMRSYLPLQGPSGTFLDELIERAKDDPRELKQLLALRVEQTEFERVLAEVKHEPEKYEIVPYTLASLLTDGSAEAGVARGEYASILDNLRESLGSFTATEDLTAERLAVLGVFKRIETILSSTP